MPNFSAIQNPAYIRMLDRWRMARAFAKGGINVLQPGYPVYTGGFFEPIPSSDDEGAGGEDQNLSTIEQRYTWRSAVFESFLQKHNKETIQEYEARQDRQVHIPLFQSLINIFSAGILRKHPEIFPKDPAWVPYLANIDLRGTTIEAFRRRALGSGLAYGHVYALTDAPRFETEATSRGEQQMRGERPYTRLISPLQLEDWQLDDDGMFLWARITEPHLTQRTPWAAPNAPQVQYRIWYSGKVTEDGNGRWELYTPETKASDSEDQTPNWVLLEGNSGPAPAKVPIRRLNLERPGSGHEVETEESPLCDALDADKYILNAMSELDELERSQTWAILHIPGFFGGMLDIGPLRALGGPETSIAPSFIAPPHQLADSKWKRIYAKLMAFRQFVGAGRGYAEFSKEERSGEALNAESEDKRNQMSLWASAMEEFENGIYEDASSYSGTDPIKVKYPEGFDIRAITTQVQELVAITGAQILPHFAKVAAAIPIVEKMLRDNGMPEEKIEEIKTSMETFSLEEPEEPAEPTMQTAEMVA